MAHDEILPQCEEEHKRAEEHLKEAPKFRDLLTRHEVELQTLFRTFDRLDAKVIELGNIKWSVILSAVGLIITIILSAFSFSVTWGRILEKVDRIEKAQDGIKP